MFSKFIKIWTLTKHDKFPTSLHGDVRHRNSVEKSSFELTIKNIQLQPLPLILIVGFEPKSRGIEPKSRGIEPKSRGFEPKSRGCLLICPVMAQHRRYHPLPIKAILADSRFFHFLTNPRLF